MFLGIDIGSVSVKIVILDKEKKILIQVYQRHQGQPLPSLIKILNEFPLDNVSSAALVGSGSRFLSDLFHLPKVSEIKALSLAAEMLCPNLSTLIEIGGQDSKLLLFKTGKNGKLALEDFAMNSLCAAGTGSFLDQQASRLNIAIEDYGKLAVKSKNPPRIAGRCTVFAKSDMIHLQQKATPVEDILAGLCLAMSRNFKSTLGKGKDFIRPIIFVGGVAANRGMIRAFENILELPSGELVVPHLFPLACALGAALIAFENEQSPKIEIGKLEKYLQKPAERETGLAPLKYQSRCKAYCSAPIEKAEKIRAYLGVDVGSISTNVVVMDANKNILAKRYLMTAGRPMEAVCQGIAQVGAEVGNSVKILGVCTTGSGRHLIGDFIGADVVKNEITAQARAAVEIDQNVDTIFEIGGQDSKYISLDRGTIVDFEMNKACAAGTGSYLEEQAEKLGINIKEEFSRMALSSSFPVRLGDRCTVFMESDVVQNLQKGVSQQDIISGLAYSIVQNYINRVVQGKRIGNNVFFQGGVAFNKAVVAAFEKVTGKNVTVPEHHEVTGAIGCCLLAKEHMEQNGINESNFRGFDVSKTKYQVDSFGCRGCANRCEINKVILDGGGILFYGHRCEKYEKKKREIKTELPDLFAEREKLLEKFSDINATEQRKIKVGIPRVLFFYWDLMPFFSAFFSELGCEVVLSDKTNREIIQSGVEAVLAEPCFPVKVAHGHCLNLLKKDIDYIFLPNIMNLPQPDYAADETHTCPYVLGFPSMAKVALYPGKSKAKLLSPTIFFRKGEKRVLQALVPVGSELGKTSRQVRAALSTARRAQLEFEKALRERGKEILHNLNPEIPALVVVSRSYNGCDSAVNLEIPKVLRELGALAIPMDFLPLSEIDLSSEWSEMYWKSGQKILAAAEIIQKDPRLNAVYFTNFGCGPDSFIVHFFKNKMGEKPFLLIEVDEHSSDIGAITRCEAFLDSLKNTKTKAFNTEKKPLFTKAAKNDLEHRVIYIPNMCDHAYVLAAVFSSCGLKSQVLPESDAESLAWGRKYTSGKECFPAQITTGDIVRCIKNPGFDPHRSAIFMPSVGGGCRFSYFHKLQRLVLNELGLKEIPIFSPNQSVSFYQDVQGQGIGVTSLRRLLQGVFAVDMLEKCLLEKRPYEKEKGAADKLYQKYLKLACWNLQAGKDLFSLMIETGREFNALPVSQNRRKPQVCVIGEIFVRSHRFSNENLIRKIEALGGEARQSTLSEWLNYINHIRFRETLSEGRYYDYFINWLTVLISKRDQRKIEEPFKYLKNSHEPTMKKIEELAEPFIILDFRGETVLGLGKASELSRNGIAGVVNVMPLTCMPGTVTTSLIKHFREKHQNLPFISIAYDGINEAGNLARLEVFMDQCTSYHSTFEPSFSS